MSGRGGGCRVVLCDDHPAVLAALVEVVASLSGARVVGQARDGYELLRLLAKVTADVLVLDLTMPAGGVALVQRLRAEHPRLAVLVFTALADPGTTSALAGVGVAEHVVKTGRLGPLREALLRQMAPSA